MLFKCTCRLLDSVVSKCKIVHVGETLYNSHGLKVKYQFYDKWKSPNARWHKYVNLSFKLTKKTLSVQ